MRYARCIRSINGFVVGRVYPMSTHYGNIVVDDPPMCECSFDSMMMFNKFFREEKY